MFNLRRASVDLSSPQKSNPIHKVKVVKLRKFPVLFNLFCGNNKLLCHKVWARPDYVCHQNFYTLPISRLVKQLLFFCAQFVLNVYQTILQPFYKDFMQINQKIHRTWRVLLSWNRRVIETWTFLVGGQGQNCPTQSFIENINLERVQGPNLQISWQLYSHHETRKPVMAGSLGILVTDLRGTDLQLRHEAQYLHRHHQGGNRVWKKSR